MDNVTPSEPALRAFSVSELSFSLKRTLEDTFTHVRVKGEISGCKVHSSGHIYFSLKDESAVLDSVCWKGVASKLAVKPEDGMEVICTGKVTTYAGRSKYQLMVNSLEASGQGALLKLLEDRKRKLAEEGLFDASCKKVLPFLPRTIGVVTSPTGAVIRDILHRLSDRMPTHVILWPVAVQGATAHLEVSKAIAGFNQMQEKPDLLIVARGGGSLEDLWAFNEEEVVRAVAASEIPLISAVGHETDTTLIDYVSDYRAPTPTGAAEKAVPVRADLLSHLLNTQNRMMTGTQRLLQESSIKVESLSRGIPQLSKITEEYQQRVDDWGDRFQNAFKQLLNLKQTQWDSLTRLMNSFSYQSVLERGFTIVKDVNGKPITHKKDTKDGMRIEIVFQDGTQEAVIGKGGAGKPRPKKKPKASPEPKKQMGFWE